VHEHRRRAEGCVSATASVRDASLDVLRRAGATTLFGNPGSTEIPLLCDLPDDLRFLLGLQECGVVGMASGYALGTGRPAVVNLHTAAGLGNAVNAIVCARDNRVPLVVVVGQQDRRQLALAPFLAGRGLERLAGDYPVFTAQPAHPQDVPGTLARAFHEAQLRRGPALVVVPMGDWEEPHDPVEWVNAAPGRVLHAPHVDPALLDELAGLVDEARSPVLAVGAGLDSPAGWAAVVALAERLGCPVWQDAFSSRAGFPQDHPQFAGHLPWSRAGLRLAFAGNDLVLAIGTPAFRLYRYDPGRLVPHGTRVAVVGDDPDEVNRSSCDLGVVGPPDVVCAGLAARVAERRASVAAYARPGSPDAPRAGARLDPGHVLAALGERLPRDVVLVEEAPSHRPELLARIPARSPLGFVAVANGALGFALPAAIGLRLALPERPVVALLGDGSSIYTVQALWSAQRYRAGVLFVVLANGRYAVMDDLARQHGGIGAWPSLAGVELAAIARGFGCQAERVEGLDRLTEVLDEVLPELRERSEPLLLEVPVS
jgi:benzoylformate decarboxylase